nr:MAG TPA: hypothetical protein [Caudoviricetes sp.]
MYLIMLIYKIISIDKIGLLLHWLKVIKMLLEDRLPTSMRGKLIIEHMVLRLRALKHTCQISALLVRNGWLSALRISNMEMCLICISKISIIRRMR